MEFPTSNNSQHKLGIRHFNSILTHSTWGHKIPQVKGSIIQEHPHPLLTPIASHSHYLCFDQLSVSQSFLHLLLGFNSSARMAHITQGISLFPGLLVYYKGIKGYKSTGKEEIFMVNPKQRSFWPRGFWAPAEGIKSCSDTSAWRSLNLILFGFYGSLISQAILTKSMAVGDWFSLQPSPIFSIRGWDWKF